VHGDHACGRQNSRSSIILDIRLSRLPARPQQRQSGRKVLVDIDDPALGALDIVVGGLQQLEDDVFDVLADIAGFGERRRQRRLYARVPLFYARVPLSALGAASAPDTPA
jgi:hypothetical protein